jgi:hypothetical protein
VEIRRFGVNLQTLASSHNINTIKFEKYAIEQGSAEKESRKINFYEKSHDFHGKLDFLNVRKRKM